MTGEFLEGPLNDSVEKIKISSFLQDQSPTKI